jgi:2-keto-4-pentenoate hydratase/2-oxohepta-3-ene-1,7-dioic acid hydratase in catechol pathway
MKLVTYDAGQGSRTGAVVGELTVDLRAASEGRLPSDMLTLIADERSLAVARDLAARAALDFRALPPGSSVPLASVRLLAPVPRPGKIICLGLNYRDHARESSAEVPAEPVVFCKASSSAIGAGEPIVLPWASSKVDYEVELAVLIGRRVKSIDAGQAMSCVLGYTVLNDVSARDYQLEKPGGQWYLGKSFDTFCPMGPWIVTADEIADPHALKLWCEVSGEILQSSDTRQMVFRIPDIVAYVSRVFTLEPGDVIGTGTPGGVGFVRTPPRFLRSGDIVRCAVECVGSLENPVY